MLSMRKKLPRSSRPRRDRFVVYAPAKRNSRSCSTFFLANHVSPSRHSLRPSESRRLALGRSFLTSCRRGDWSSARRLLGPTPAGRSTPGTSYVSTGERRQLLSVFRTCVRRGLLLLRSAATTSHWRCGCARSTTCSVWKVISPSSFRAYPWWTGRSSCVRRITCIGRSMCRVEACRSTGDPQLVRSGRVLSD